MLEKLLNYLKNKKILILGFGIEGESTYRFLRKYFPEKKLFIADKNINLLENRIELIEDPYLEVSLGEGYLNDIDKYDLILKAPGISLKDIDISTFKEKLSSQLELFLEFINVFTIGITGTKGKSTTSSLIYKILIDQGKDAYILSNIGEPIFNDIDLLKENSIAVLELSSHSLEYVKKSTNISIILNVFEEHLDYYKSFEEYIKAKYNIAKYQKNTDFLIYNYDNINMQRINFNYKTNDYAVSMETIPNTKNKAYLKDEYIYCNDEKIMNINENMNLKGIHNINNILFVFTVAIILNLDLNKAKKTIKEFKPLEHRMEYVGNIDGIDYYNDSIATIPEATINAIKAIDNINTLIIGGKDRGVNLNNLIDFLKKSKIENIICMPKTGEYIKEALSDTSKNVKYVQTLKEAVSIAKKVTKKNTVCLLSPSASSYGYFKNFEERGNLFKQYVKEI